MKKKKKKKNNNEYKLTDDYNKKENETQIYDTIG